MKYCEEYAALLSAFADGEATEQEREEILSHLDSCEGCREYLAELMSMKEELTASVPELPENFSAQVMWNVRSEKTKKAKKNRRVLTALGSLAACLVLLIAIPQILNGGMTMEAAPEAGGTMEGAMAEDDMVEESVVADSAMPEAPDGAVNTPSYSSDTGTDAEKGNERFEGVAVSVPQELMDSWLEQETEESIACGESAAGEVIYYLVPAQYENFRAFAAERGVDLPLVADGEFIEVYME